MRANGQSRRQLDWPITGKLGSVRVRNASLPSGARVPWAERTLSGLGALSDQQAERVAQRMDRLASQLLEVSAPASIDAVHERLGTKPAGREELESLADRMGPPDGKG
ncbi:MAG: hypothetical protein M3401_17755 [Actinomycetota bacterium]|nr:hypothetical protein [Actinomycetota bacterium]